MGLDILYPIVHGGLMNNQAQFRFKGEGKTGRFFLSPYHLMEANHETAIQNSRVKRGETKELRCTKHKAWGCGCCVHVLDASIEPMVLEQIDHFQPKRGFRRTWIESTKTETNENHSYPDMVDVDGKQVPFCVAMGIAFGYTKPKS